MFQLLLSGSYLDKMPLAMTANPQTFQIIGKITAVFVAKYSSERERRNKFNPEFMPANAREKKNLMNYFSTRMSKCIESVGWAVSERKWIQQRLESVRRRRMEKFNI